MAVLHPNPSALEALGVVPTPKSSIRLRPKEIANASKDGFTVVVRPRPEGGFHVLTVNVETQTQVGWPLIAESRSDVPQAITELMRDMSKFMGVGDNMAQSGRHRDKRSIARVASQWIERKGSVSDSVREDWARNLLPERIRSINTAMQQDPGYSGWSLDILRKLVSSATAAKAIKALKALQESSLVLKHSLEQAQSELSDPRRR